MKRVMVILIVLLACFSLFACNTKLSAIEGVPDYTVTDATAYAKDAPVSSDITKAGYYDPAVDYSKNYLYKIGYLMDTKTILYAMFSRAFEAWADRMNIIYNDFASNKDNEYYLYTCQLYAEQGYDGLLLDPDSSIFPRVVELMNELDMPWMSCMAPALAEDNKTLLHPYVGFDNTQAGVAMANFNIEYAKKTWPDAKPEEIGAIFIGWSAVPALDQREQGYRETFAAAYPDSADNYIFCDGVVGDMTYQTGYNLVSPVLAANRDIKYWLVSGFFDDFTDGAAGALTAAGKADTTVCSTFGGSALIDHWDAGEKSCWRGAIYTDQRLYAMPIICGLYAMMSGQTTAEELWPEWINHSTGDKYATVQLPTAVITEDTYREYMMWVASYTGIHQVDYNVAPGNYTATVEVPSSYNTEADMSSDTTNN